MVFANLYIGGLFILVSLLTIAGFVFQRDKYWLRVWKELGKPDVESIDELKGLYQQSHKNKLSKFNFPDGKSPS